MTLTLRLTGLALLAASFLQLSSNRTRAQSFAPNDIGTTVAGYQDDFDGAALGPGWQVLGANAYSVSGGMLHVTTANGDPNHLLYTVAGYNNSVQEVLARIRVTNFGTGDQPRGGISTCVDPAASTAGGIDLHFRDETIGRHIEFLDDLRAWGTEYAFAWQNNTWYWLRLRHEPNAASQGGVNDVFGKIWLADGSQAEPASWQDVYDYIPSRTARAGYAGIVAGSSGGTSEFDVDYILIKASGLPNITVAPAVIIQAPVTITTQPQNQTVLECQSAVFTVGYSGTPPISFQWYKNNALISGATNSSYTVSSARSLDSGSYRVILSNVASNTQYTATSGNASLTVSTDIVRPTLLGAGNNGLNQIVVAFSKPVTASTATNVSNYAITNSSGSLPVLGATLSANQTNVTLVTSGQIEGVAYTLTVNRITDQCQGNLIPPNSQATFMAVAYATSDIGSSTPAGSTVAVTGGFNVTGGGRDAGGTNDQFQFSYQQRSGDFDLKVRIESLGLSDAWAEAGLMARETLDVGSRFASTMTTPSISGSYYQSRTVANGTAALSGSFPANFPNTWLRLRRVGNQFTGYGSYDGQNWTLLGTDSIAMPATVYFGFAVSSHNTSQTTTAAFRDLAEAAGGAVGTPLPTSVEPLGQSSRKTPIVISEIMYNPLDRADHRNTEFVELFNSGSTAADISGWRLDQDADYNFPPGTTIPAGGFIVVAAVPADVEYVYGITGVLGPFSSTNSLPNSSGVVQLRHRTGAVFLEAHYGTETPWPIAADGAGHSLILARPSYGEANVEAWAASDQAGGSPGRLDPVTVDALRNVVINEFLAHTDDPEVDYIELYNHSTQSVDISGCYLTDDRNTNKFRIPPGTILGPRAFISYDQNELGFALSADGERIYFRDAANTRVLDAVRFEAQMNGVSMGRFPDGAPGFNELATKTPGATNGPVLTREIVINEIMYSPISGDSDDEYVELYNRGTNAMNISGWRMMDGISFTFPPNTVIPAGGYLVVARNAAHLIPRYSNLNAGNTVGDFGGGLSNGGERIALAMADPSVHTNNSIVTTNYTYIVVDEVTYRDGGRWGQWSDGGGSSLELIDPRSDNRLAPNWADSDETAKAPWTVVSVRGVLDNGTSTADQLQMLLQGAGECLVDDVEVRNAAGVNLIANGTFETDASGWTAEGTQEPSGLESNEGYNSTKSYHIRGTDRGDNQVNRIRTPLTAGQIAGVTNTIRAKVRWLKGHPEMLFRLRGNWLEAPVEMDLPTNLGTPGARNSRAVPNAGPAIYQVTHNPPVPAANEAVIVTARVNDPDGIASVQLKYRLDPDTTTILSIPMLDNGTGGDAVAGDDLYTATLPGQTANVMVAFYVEATDRFVPATTTRFPNNAPTRECLVRFGDPVYAGSFPSYRFWMTQATYNTWDGRNNLNNTANEVTFVLGNHRVIYNASAGFAGSPYIAPGFTTPNGNRCGYALEWPADDQLYGNPQLQIDWPGGHGNENTAVQEEMAYWIADQMNLPHTYRYYIRLTVNGVSDMQRGGVFEGTMQPGRDFIEAWSPGNTEGGFYRIDRGFEFSDAGGLIADPMPELRVYNTPDLVNGGIKKKLAKYRWYWLKRSFDSANDYTNVFVMADALNAASPEPYTSQTETLADVEQWMGIFCAEHIINNFDSWGHDIGKNMYMFIPNKGRATLYMYDLDWLMLVSPNGPGNYTALSGPLFSGEDPTVLRMYNHPPFRRAYFRAVQNAVDNAFVTNKYEALMDAKYNALVANGITLCDGQALVPPTAVKTWFGQRRGFLVGQLAAVAAPFNVLGTNSFTISSNLVTLTGTAPITIKTIEVNGVPWPVTWTGVNNWIMRLPISDPTNYLSVVGYDARGNIVPGASNLVTIVYDGGAPPETPPVVINEIMYNPVVSGAEYLELFNASPNFAFDLSGWRLNGLDYTFRSGSLMAPNSFLVLAKDAQRAFTAHSTNILVYDEYNGNLQGNGETLTLFIPGTNSATDKVVDKVRYEGTAPWPTNANGTGASLQLVDASQDNSRVGNWSASPAWVFVTKTGNILTGTNMLLSISSAGSVYVDDITLIGPGGTNALVNGDFESDLGPEWIFGTNYTSSVIASNISHSGTRSLLINGTAPGGTALANSIQQRLLGKIITNTNYTLSFWCLANTNSVLVQMRTINGGNLIMSATSARIIATPGALNGTSAILPPFPALWINEVQPQNTSGIIDNHGQREPWIEIYNEGASVVSLEGLYLSDNYLNLTQWAFPAGSSINPGEFKVVFADGEPEQSTASQLHASFRLAAGTGSVALSRLNGGAPQVLDYINYNEITAGDSYGDFPDGQPFQREEFFYVTPGAANNGSAAPLQVFINEWMASNTGTLADPANSPARYDDWFELYNAGNMPADLSGHFLTDNLANKTQFQIPKGYTIPPKGFLLVWADNEPGQNSTNRPDLHVNFALSRTGEAIGLFAADGTQIDAVTFGVQTNDVSQGRYPDGSQNIYFMSTPTPRAANTIGNVTPPMFNTLARSGDQLTLGWSTTPGQTYRIEYTDDLTNPNWQPLAPDIHATGNSESVNINVTAPPHRFFRIGLVP